MLSLNFLMNILANQSRLSLHVINGCPSIIKMNTYQIDFAICVTAAHRPAVDVRGDIACVLPESTIVARNNSLYNRPSTWLHRRCNYYCSKELRDAFSLLLDRRREISRDKFMHDRIN